MIILKKSEIIYKTLNIAIVLELLILITILNLLLLLIGLKIILKLVERKNMSIEVYCSILKQKLLVE